MAKPVKLIDIKTKIIEKVNFRIAYGLPTERILITKREFFNIRRNKELIEELHIFFGDKRRKPNLININIYFKHLGLPRVKVIEKMK
jgi:hypothetical protein